MDDLLAEFLTKANASFDRLDNDVLHLEDRPTDPELLRRIVVEFHTIKAACSFIGLTRLEALAHAGESLIGRFREGELAVTPEGVSLVLQTIDAIEALVTTLKETEEEPEGDDAELIGRLNAMEDDQKSPSPPCADPKLAQDGAEILDAQEIKDSEKFLPKLEPKAPNDQLAKDGFTDDYDALSAGLEKLACRMNEAKASRSEKFQMLENVLENVSDAFTARFEELTACKERFDHLQQTNLQLSNLVKEMIDLVEVEVNEKNQEPLTQVSAIAEKWLTQNS